MSTVVISIEGTDITDDIIFSDAEFVTSAKGAAGQARFRIKDLRHEKSFVVGNSLTLDIDGIRKWSGYVMAIHRGYFWDGSPHPCDTNLVPRYLLIEGADANILLNKRVLYDKVNGETVKLTAFPAGTDGQTIVNYYVANHTDLPADGVTTTLVENLGTPSVDSEISGSASWRVNDFMRYVNYNLGGIWYLNPNFDLVFTDVDTPSAAYGISDQPGVGEVGCRDLQILSSASDMRNDALVWGVGQGPSGIPVFSREQDSASIALHGRWQKGDFNQSVYKQATVDHIAHSYVYGSPVSKRGGKDDQVTIKCTVFTPDFTVAEKVPLRSAVFGYSDVVPIRSQRITFPTKDQPKYDLTLSFDVDDPWTSAEFWWPNWDTTFPVIPIPSFPLPSSNPCGPQMQCCETFTRTLVNGWGSSEFAIPDVWSTTTNTYFSVNGSEGVVQNQSSPPFGQKTYITLPVGLSVPFEITAVSRWERDSGATPSLNGFWGRTRLTLDTIGGSPGSQPFRQPYAMLQWDFENGTLSGVANSLRVSSQLSRPSRQYGPITTAAIYSPNATVQHNVRWRVEATAMYVKVWPVGGGEPVAWTEQLTGMTELPTSFSVMNMDMIVGDAFNSGFVLGVRHYFDNLCIIEGLACNGDGEVVSSGSADDRSGAYWAARSFEIVRVGGVDTVNVMGTTPFIEAQNNNTTSARSFVTFGLSADAYGPHVNQATAYSFSVQISTSGTPSGETAQWELCSGSWGSGTPVWDEPGTVLWSGSHAGIGYTRVPDLSLPIVVDASGNKMVQLFLRRVNVPATDPLEQMRLTQGGGSGDVQNLVLATSNPCLAPTPPAADNSCLPTYRCESLTQIATPANQPDTYTYWATANNQQFQVASSEVWVNGLRIRLGYDYDEHYTEGYIGVHAGIANDRSMIGGVLEGDGSGDIVRMCYWTACYVITEA
jgi:hypothetical protein